MFETDTIEEEDAITILNKDESHFFDVTRKEGDGKTVQKKCCSFANADGGELFIGIIDKSEQIIPNGILGRWDGFQNDEEANSFIANVFSLITPQIEGIRYDFLEIKNQTMKGKVLRISIEKSPNVHKTSSRQVYLRKGAQCLEIFDDAILRLKLAKGVSSYENQVIGNYEYTRLIESSELKRFLQDYSPKTEPRTFLRKQLFLKANGQEVICAGILLYDECPSVVLPKKCAIKVSRYSTSEAVPERDHLKRQETVEGPLYQQIDQSIKVIQNMVESVPIMGSKGLEKAKYPPEAIKEILVNAIIHRDYNLSDDVIVLVYNNRIEIQSPGVLPGHITINNILDERFSRNPKIVRLLNKYQNPPNKDIGEGLNTAFQKMKDMRLKAPVIEIRENKVVVILPHQPLASPEEQILEYLKHHKEITNSTVREITGIRSENTVKQNFYKLKDNGMIEPVPEKRGKNSAWRLISSN